MRLGIIGDWSEEGFRYVHDLGLDCIEFCYNYMEPTGKLLSLVPSINEWQQKYGVQVLSLGRWGSQRINDDGTVNEKILREDFDVIDAASAIGCPVFNCGCNYIQSRNYKENCDSAIVYFTRVLDYAKGKNVKVATYNCDWANFVYNDKAWSVIHNALPELGIKYDVSHCVNRHGDYLKEMRDWGDRFYHFHLKGTLYVDGEHYDDPPAGLDQTDWPSVMAMLHIKNYDQMVSIEPHSGEWKGEKGEWGVKFTINFIKPYLR